MNHHYPTRPRPGGASTYSLLREVVSTTSLSPCRQLFTITATTAAKEGEPLMDNANNFLINLVMKPLAPGLILRPQETQLLLAYIGEILKEAEDEERRLLEV